MIILKNFLGPYTNKIQFGVHIQFTLIRSILVFFFNKSISIGKLVRLSCSNSRDLEFSFAKQFAYKHTQTHS